MKEIFVPQEYITFCNQKTDLVFLEQLKCIFAKHKLKISSTSDATYMARNTKDDTLFTELYDFLEDVTVQHRAFIYDLLIDSNFSKPKIAKRIIEDIYLLIDSESLLHQHLDISWFLCDNLRELKQQSYINDYLKFLSTKQLGTARQPIIYLLASFKNCNMQNIFLEYIHDDDINGHILEVLAKKTTPEIKEIAKQFLNDERDWVKKIAQKIRK
jgi:hypothetical protein